MPRLSTLRCVRAPMQGGKDFGATSLFCKWGAVAGGGWKCLEGQLSGQTQVDHPKDTDVAKWAHPIGPCKQTNSQNGNEGRPGCPPSHTRVFGDFPHAYPDMPVHVDVHLPPGSLSLCRT